MAGYRIYYVPPRLVGRIDRWSGRGRPGGESWILARARALGFNAIWLSPFHEPTRIGKDKDGRRETGSIYAIRDHFRIGRPFASGRGAAEDSAHLKHFTARARRQGMTVFADLVFNHVAADHPLVAEEDAQIAALRRWANAGADAGADAGSGRGLTVLHRAADGTVNEHGDGPAIGARLAGGAGPEMLAGRLDHGTGAPVFWFRFQRQPDLCRTVAGPAEDPWTDAAPVNYDSPEGMRFFVTGPAAYWKRQIDWYLDHGFTGFRCDVAPRVPPRIWSELAAHSRRRAPELPFLGETLGQGTLIDEMAAARVPDGKGGDRPAFDLGMIAAYAWDFEGRWLIDEEIPRIERMARAGAAAFPDSHDTPETVAGHFLRALPDGPDRQAAVARICRRNYALAALIANSTIMQMGYELGKPGQNHVFEGADGPEAWARLRRARPRGHPLDLSRDIAAINQLKARLGMERCRVVPREMGSLAGGRLTRLTLDLVDIETGTHRHTLRLALNRRPEDGPVRLDRHTRTALTADGGAALVRTDLPGDSAGGSDRDAVADVVIFHSPLAPAPRPGRGRPAHPHGSPPAP